MKHGEASAGGLVWPTATVFLLCTLAVAITRLPLMPHHLFSFDSVNFALSLQQFDPSRHQPQPPGYPFFVAEARLFHFLFANPELVFSIIKILSSGLALGFLYLLCRRLSTARIALYATTLLLVSPPFWHTGLASPIRAHLAVASCLFAYLIWRAVAGEHRFLFYASLMLGLSAGFRLELPIVLMPLWIWAAWRIGRKILAAQAFALLAAGLSISLTVILLSTASARDTLETIGRYAMLQTDQTSMLTGADFASFRRMLGRNLVWYGVGTLGWIWSAWYGWKHFRQSPEARNLLGMLLVWWIPPFLFNGLFHVGSPGHVVSGLPPMCIIGAISMASFEDYVRSELNPQWPIGAALTGTVLICNLLFFADHLPAHISAEEPQTRWGKVVQPIRFGLYETSYPQVRWTEQMTDEAFDQISKLKRETSKPVIVIWTREARPSWRKVTYYFPDLPVYVLEEKGDQAVDETHAILWQGSSVKGEFKSGSQVPVAIPPDARVIWLTNGATRPEMAPGLSVQSAPPVYYADLHAGWPQFIWRSFRFVAEPPSIRASNSR